MLTVATVVGARPQFVKAAALSRAIASRNEKLATPVVRQLLIHTGQHYDHNLSDVFFEQLGLPEPDVHLGVGSGPHGEQTGEMLIRLEPHLSDGSPDIVVTFGDTNSTLAAAVVAAKLCIPVAHIEAGLRSWRRDMPEEVNRVVTDHLSNLLFCPSAGAVENLHREGITNGVHLVGDVMYDVLRWHLARMEPHPPVLERHGLRSGQFAVATVHRAENTDASERLTAIIDALDRLAADYFPVIVPLHPRTRSALGTQAPRHATVIEPVPYQEMLALQANARVVLTDSGGIQKEAYWLGVPCVTLRDETEWPETVSAGWNVLVGADPASIVAAASRERPEHQPPALYGLGDAAERIVDILVETPHGASPTPRPPRRSPGGPR